MYVAPFTPESARAPLAGAQLGPRLPVHYALAGVSGPARGPISTGGNRDPLMSALSAPPSQRGFPPGGGRVSAGCPRPSPPRARLSSPMTCITPWNTGTCWDSTFLFSLNFNTRGSKMLGNSEIASLRVPVFHGGREGSGWGCSAARRGRCGYTPPAM